MELDASKSLAVALQSLQEIQNTTDLLQQRQLINHAIKVLQSGLDDLFDVPRRT